MMKKISVIYSLLACSTLLSGCGEEVHDFESKLPAEAGNFIYIDEADRNFETSILRKANGSLQLADTCYQFRVYANAPVIEYTTAKLAIDNNLVRVYNLKHGTNYQPVVADYFSFGKVAGQSMTTTTSQMSLSFPQGATISTDTAMVKLTKTGQLTNRDGYIIPVRLIQAKGQDVITDTESRICYFKVNVTQEITLSFEGAESVPLNYITDSLSVFPGSFSLKYDYPPLKDVEVIMTIDNSLVAAYNAEHGTNYKTVEGFKVSATLKAGSSVAEGQISFEGDVDALSESDVYLLPLKITSVSSADVIPNPEASLCYVKMGVQSAFLPITFKAGSSTNPYSDLGTRVSNRADFRVVAVYDNTGKELSPGSGTKDGMFANSSVYYNSEYVNLVVDLGKEYDNITGIYHVGYGSNTVSYHMESVTMAYATEEMYAAGKEMMFEPIDNGDFMRYVYMKFGTPIKARYIIYRNAHTASIENTKRVSFRDFYIYTK